MSMTNADCQLQWPTTMFDCDDKLTIIFGHCQWLGALDDEQYQQPKMMSNKQSKSQTNDNDQFQ